jgi:light-regulated signal transduction histidine kinase (bacteriophytochrome)
VFQNLISNAIKFRKPDTQPIITISVKKDDSTFTFSVKDNGIGIEKNYYERIFVIFQRLHNQKEFPGSGIGLAHCKKIIEMHGGEIWVESEPGRGSTFYFTIPIT